MTNNENNKLTVAFGCGNSFTSQMGLIAALHALEVGLQKNATFADPPVNDMVGAVVIDQEHLPCLRAILLGSQLKDAFKNAENHVGTVQTDSLKNFSVMITAPTALTL